MRRPYATIIKKREERIGAMEIQPYPEIIEYTAQFMDGKRIKSNSTSIQSLETQLQHHGSPVLRMLILHFIHPTYHSYYYPYRNHNIVLEKQKDDTFRIQFHHYYNVNNERIDIPIQQQYYDYCALEHFLFQRPILYETLYGRLIVPSFEWYPNPPFPPFPPPSPPFVSYSLSDSLSPLSLPTLSPPSPPPIFQEISSVIWSSSSS